MLLPVAPSILYATASISLKTTALVMGSRFVSEFYITSVALHCFDLFLVVQEKNMMQG